jgi:hypothetical protein
MYTLSLHDALPISGRLHHTRQFCLSVFNCAGRMEGQTVCVWGGLRSDNAKTDGFPTVQQSKRLTGRLHHTHVSFTFQSSTVQAEWKAKLCVYGGALRSARKRPDRISRVNALLKSIPSLVVVTCRTDWQIQTKLLPAFRFTLLETQLWSIVQITRNTERRVPWLTFLLRIYEVPGSYLGPEIGYIDWGFCGFPKSLQKKNVGLMPEIGPWPLQHSYQIHDSLTVQHSVIHSLTSYRNKPRINK